MSRSACSSSVKVRASAAWLPSAPLRCTGRPTTTRSTSRSRTSLTTEAGSGGSITGNGVVRVPVGSQIAAPIRTVPWSRASTRNYLPQLPLDDRAGLRQGVVELGRVLAARLGHVVAAAPATADHTRRGADQLRRRKSLLHRARARQRDQRDFVPRAAAEQLDDRVPERALDAVGEV